MFTDSRAGWMSATGAESSEDASSAARCSRRWLYVSAGIQEPVAIVRARTERLEKGMAGPGYGTGVPALEASKISDMMSERSVG